ncbi:carbohydrate ABC transporter permease [Paenibacillus sp. IB182496]|uniref:Carbohydrate ABC transporter permease n=1 Tax=Paenibacillus sabuli TaxID=2772509 RepID=A0A927BRB0_9BACL|nr:carbohydrate ABC transporter permease [Paenibacillus sabuli]MBD2844043.1 carbohydrate ABC transporter permease [Paenibacillus sabuli]
MASRHDSKGERLFDVFNYVGLSILILACLYPFAYVVFASLSEANAFMAHSGILLHPLGLDFSSYKAVFSNPNILQGYRNTLIIVVGGTALNLALTSLGAYGLSRKNVKLATPIMLGIVFTMFFSGGIIPVFLLVTKTLHLGDNLLALILPTAINTWNLIIMRTSFAAIPEELIESARIDGASEPFILARIVLPLSMSVISVMLLFYGVQHWNAWFQAVIFLRDRELYPVQLILREILIQNNTSAMSQGAGSGSDTYSIGETIKYATVIVTTLPILFIYPFLQKYFVKGVMIGAIKG